MGTIFTVLLIILLVILLLVAVFLICPLSVLLSVGEKEMLIKLKVFGISVRIPLDKKQSKDNKDKDSKEEKEVKKEENEDKESAMKKFLEMRNTFARIKEALGKALSYLSHKIKIPQMGVIGKFGLGDAALTGVSYGMVEAFTGVVTGFMQQFFVFEKPVYRKLDMDYDNVVFKLQFAMQIKTRPWYLLRGGLIFYKHWKQS